MSLFNWWWFLLTDEGNGNMNVMRLATLATGAVPAGLLWCVVRIITGRWMA